MEGTIEISSSPNLKGECDLKMRRIATIIALGFLICFFATGSARATDKGGHRARGESDARHSDNRGRADLARYRVRQVWLS